MAAAAGVLLVRSQLPFGCNNSTFDKNLFWVPIQTYDTVYAPPATVLLHDLQFQIPTECLLTVVFPQKVQTYLACWVISIFFTCFRREAPYLEESKRQFFDLVLESSVTWILRVAESI
jgi:hypothetical protein